MKVINLLIVLFCLCACNTNKGKNKFTDNIVNSISLKSHAIIYLQPYEDFSQKDAEKLSAEVLKNLNGVFPGLWTIKILPSKSLPKEAYYNPRKRYLADVLLRDLPELHNSYYVIGLTHKDISYKIHNCTNYGIMGLTPLGKRKSIVSDFRAKGNNFIAVIIHEFGHGFYSLRHCYNTKCIMCDYQEHKGKPFTYKLCKDHSFTH